jgi:hypothetical protein
MEVTRSNETSVHIRTTRRYNPEYGNIRNYRWENPKSYYIVFSINMYVPLYGILEHVSKLQTWFLWRKGKTWIVISEET